MKLGVKEMKREYKKVNIDQIEVIFWIILKPFFINSIILGSSRRNGRYDGTG